MIILLMNNLLLLSKSLFLIILTINNYFFYPFVVFPFIHLISALRCFVNGTRKIHPTVWEPHRDSGQIYMSWQHSHMVLARSPLHCVHIQKVYLHSKRKFIIDRISLEWRVTGKSNWKKLYWNWLLINWKCDSLTIR